MRVDRGDPDLPEASRLLEEYFVELRERLAPVPVRLPLPPAEHQASIYENQRATGRRFFETAADRGEDRQGLAAAE